MDEDTSGPEPDEGSDGESDASGFEWSVAEPRPDRSEETQTPADDREGDGVDDRPERIPMNLGGWEDETSVAEESDGDSEDEDDEDDEFPGPEPGSTPIEPESPTLENAVFVVLGMVAMVLVLARLVTLGFG